MINNNESTDGRKSGLSRLIEIAGSKKWWLFASITLAMVATIAQFVPIWVVYQIIAELAENALNISNINRDLLYQLGMTSLISVGVFGVTLYSSSMLSHVAAFNILYEIRVKVAEKLTRLSMGFFTRTTSGEIKKVMSEDVERIELFVAHHIPDITSAILFPILIIIYLFFTDWRLAIAALIPFPIALGTIIFMMASQKTKEAYADWHVALEKMNSAVVEYVRGMPVIKVFGTAMDSFAKLKNTVLDYGKMAQEMSADYSKTYTAFLTAASSSLVFIVPTAVYILNQTAAGEQFIPTVLFFAIIGGGFFFPLLKLMFALGQFNQITIGVSNIDKLLYMQEIKESDVDHRPENTSIEFDEVSFAYEETVVLKGISFRAEPGTVTALVGPSGAGKTTVGKLAARFWDVNAGSIKIGGVDIRDMKLSTLMDQVAFVFQDGFLFFDTIEENIRMGDSEASMEDVIDAAKAAQCHEFIEKLPNKYQTLVGEGGTYLSGGEQQRISIARAILKNSPIVFFDEATAYADPENEGKILEGLARLIKEKTVVVIAHRLSTITRANQILVIDEGKVVEKGTHDTLVAEQGLYHRMWETYSRAREWTISQKGAELS